MATEPVTLREVLELPHLSPRTESQLHLDLHALYQAGLLAKFIDEDGLERFQPTREFTS